jgi:hypothetical protein
MLVNAIRCCTPLSKTLNAPADRGKELSTFQRRFKRQA